MAHLIDDETVAKMGHPIVVAPSDMGLPSLFDSSTPAEIYRGLLPVLSPLNKRSHIGMELL
jgi:hypothetical protein